MSPSFSVYVEFSTPDASPDTYEALFDALADVDGAVGPSPNGRPSARLTLQAPDFEVAASKSLAVIAEAVAASAAPVGSVTCLHIDKASKQATINALKD